MEITERIVKMKIKFSLNQQAYDIRYGLCIIKEIKIDEQYPVCARPLNENFGSDTFKLDGKVHHSHTNSLLLTLDEAKDRGFKVPEEPLKWEFEVLWENGGLVALKNGGNFLEAMKNLEGKRGHLTFVEEK